MTTPSYSYSLPASQSIIFIPDAFSTQVLSFLNLKNGWDNGEGGPISRYVIDRAIALYKELFTQYFQFELTPQADDSIKITLYIKDHFLDITVYKSRFEVSYERGVGYDFTTEFYSENLSLNKINPLLNTIRQKCFTLEPLTSQNIVEVKVDSREHSEITKVGGYQSLIMTVQSFVHSDSEINKSPF